MIPQAALITGAARRIGREIALNLARKGWKIALHYHQSQNQAQQTRTELLAAGAAQVALLPADFMDEAQITNLIPQAVSELGCIGLLVNNASIFEADGALTTTREGWDRHFESNLRAPFVLSQAFARQAAPLGIKADEPVANGCIVNMIDQRVLKLTSAFTSYTLAKSALWTMTQTLALALAPQVRVNAIAPGITLANERQSFEHFTTRRAQTPLQRGANPMDICTCIDFILGADAMTGQIIALDGGQHL